LFTEISPLVCGDDDDGFHGANFQAVKDERSLAFILGHPQKTSAIATESIFIYL
jgi:hypothetical protein